LFSKLIQLSKPVEKDFSPFFAFLLKKEMNDQGHDLTGEKLRFMGMVIYSFCC
jgi:hypothetical protein